MKAKAEARNGVAHQFFAALPLGRNRRATGIWQSPDILGAEYQSMPEPLTRITRDPGVMGGKPCLRGLRVAVGTVVGLVATGQSTAKILARYPCLEEADIREALEYAVWRMEGVEVPRRQPA